jgi:ribosomal protein S27AE
MSGARRQTCPRCNGDLILRRVPNYGLRLACSQCDFHTVAPFYEERRDAGQQSLLEDNDDDE